MIESETEGFLRISGRIRYPLCHRRPGRGRENKRMEITQKKRERGESLLKRMKSEGRVEEKGEIERDGKDVEEAVLVSCRMSTTEWR
ncbi:hypothetical protein PoB_002343700 [Plakobranchus ocellatus]|uniref:Uncharacterized protein n=1 Tax=Plakobranchus ocellatus TaxID=259542 RepID=A0AAV3ZNZ7_9GAST|nr:hypothetical protein PoB_002343700 [Plakobranchus ocellatus]